MQIEIVGVTAQNERVAIEMRIHAQGKERKDYKNRFHFLFVVRDGIIVEVSEYMDSAVFVKFIR